MGAAPDLVAESSAKHRPEIQGLRAIAVLAVLVFHVWPGALPGGYVGVDVFFVISGYLITALLLREQTATGSIDLVRFYGRRARRLLPAASVVMLAVVLGIGLFPRMRWGDIAEDVIASALYVENWLLASRAVDYLAAEETASPLQHFWSLSLEEQFYLAWPAMLLGAAWIARRVGLRADALVRGTMVLVFAASLAYSIHVTEANPGYAYFATTTRAWELALGGLLAAYTAWRGQPETRRAFAAWLGLLLIAIAMLTFGVDTAFPGYAALWPTVGAALVLMSGASTHRWSAYRWLRARPMQWVGDVSYSLYLWHWPVIMVYRAQVGDAPIGLLPGLGLVGVSLVLAHFSKAWVEDRFRRPDAAPRHRWRPLGVGAASMATVVLAGVVLLRVGAPGPDLRVQAEVDSRLHPGALALAGVRTPTGVAFVPTLETAKQDLADAYAANCIAPSRGRDVRECRYGKPGARHRVVAVGDSHMVHWLPALQRLATAHDWDLLALTKTGCPFAQLDESNMRSEATKSCAEWNRKVAARIRKDRPELVIVAQSIGALGEIVDDPARGPAEKAARMADAWRAVIGPSTHLVAIRETPRLEWDAPECLARPGASARACSQPLAASVPVRSAVADAAALVPKAALLDMTDTVCSRYRCTPIVGNVLVWRDKHHLTATYARSISPLLARRIGERLPGVAGFATHVAAAGTRREGLDPVLVGGLKTLPFDYAVRVNRVVTTRDGGSSRELSIEFLEGDVDIVDRRLAETFGGIGYTREPPVRSGSGTRSVFHKRGSPNVLVWVRRGSPPGERYRIQSPGARGTVYIAWDSPLR
jgi:peptidoglycan/LPS O-acetylase OafA/YrhL